eukprot:8139374-Ditylum_brightwellii.AAC.1
MGLHPGYKGVDWVSDASCCQLCNRGGWGRQGEVICCQPNITSKLIGSSMESSGNIMLCHGVKAEE